SDTLSSVAGCDSISTLDLRVSAVEAAILSVTNANCSVATGTITVTSPSPAQGLSYSIDGINYTNTIGVFNNVLPGNYNVTVKNAAGCISTATIATITS